MFGVLKGLPFGGLRFWPWPTTFRGDEYVALEHIELPKRNSSS